jgi:hypothetical protein
LAVALSIVGLSVASAAPAANASTLKYLCDGNGACWFNIGVNQAINTNLTGTGWAAIDSGLTWSGHEMYEIRTGSNTCAMDEAGVYLLTETCSYQQPGFEDPTELFYLAASGAIVGDSASGTMGQWECLAVTNHSGGLLGNVACPAGTPPANERFTWKAA